MKNLEKKKSLKSQKLSKSTSSNVQKSAKKTQKAENSKKSQNLENSNLKCKQKNIISKEHEISLHKLPKEKISREINPTRITDFFVNSSNIYSNEFSENFKKSKNDKEIFDLQNQIEKLQNQNKNLYEKVENLKKEKEMSEFRIESLEEKNLLRENLYEKFKKKARIIIPDLVFDLERQNLRKDFEVLMIKKHQYGFLKNSNARSYDDWVDGVVITDLKNERDELKSEIEKVEKKRKKIRYKKKLKKITNERQCLKKKLEELIKKLEDVNQKLENCKKEKIYIIHSDKKFELSLDCLFSKKTKKREKWPIIKNYKILSFLGRGGFAEVYKAYDLIELKYVAIKLHYINEKWNSSTKESYIKKTERENKVFSKLNHSGIVKYYDSFSIDENTFCTILEYCDGNDLSYKLKEKTNFSEKETKIIIKKIVEVILYLNEMKPKIIHYDLKPGNILFKKNGDLKITDFGLCKMNDSELSTIQLTSPGCGTFDYLPPECFSNSRNNLNLISTKVDIWSIGIIFYQLFFGFKPFGSFGKKKIDGDLSFCVKGRKMSQWSEGFVRKCLVRNMEKRIGVFEAWKLFEESGI